MSSCLRLLVLCGLLVLVSGCAFMNRENTVLMNQVEERLWPEDTLMQVVAFPVVFPLGFVAVLIDISVVHPASVVGDAWDETSDVLWDELDWDTQYVTECAALPWRALMTPLFFAGDFFVRALFNIPTRAEEERERARKEQESDGSKPDEKGYQIDTEFWERFESEDPQKRWTVYQEGVGACKDSKTFVRIILKALKDPDPVLRYAALWIIWERRLDLKGDRLTVVEQIAREDENPINRALARRILDADKGESQK